MKKKLLILPMIAVAIMAMLFLASCDLQALLNGNASGKGETGETPTIIGISTLKASEGFAQSTEYKFNSQGKNPMALTFSEHYYIIIHYKNDSDYTISSVKLSWKDSSKGQSSVTQTFSRDSFATISDGTATYIEFTAAEEGKLKTGTIEYTVNSVFYVGSSGTNKVVWGEDVERSITVATRPYFKLKLNYMNRDMRRGSTQREDFVYDVPADVYYKTQMNNYITSVDFDGEIKVPEKSGGWVFAGWYTEPLGQGYLVTADDTYDYWCDMTLYAYYERMYDVERVNLDRPIVHSYLNSYSETETVEFNTGVILKNKGRNSIDNGVCSNYSLEIPDTIVIEEYTVVKSVGSDGMPDYKISETASEFPVVRLAPNVFTNYNTILRATMGKYVEEIGYRAFSGCTKMETLYFNSDSVLKYIGDFAFESTDVLGKTTPFTLPGTVEYLGMCAFRYSGWGITVTEYSGSGGENRLVIPPTWKYIGYKCFANTRFARVMFKPGCHFDSQISEVEGKKDESAQGQEEIRYGQNRIGASLFSQCYMLWSVSIDSDNGAANALNIIPDNCFDAQSWYNKSDKRDGQFNCISYITFGEGIKYIGQKAFTYQVKIQQLPLPKTLEEVDRYAFYNCISVINLNFEHVSQDTINNEGIKKALKNDSQLKILKSYAFANLTGIDVVYITSGDFALYGNGVFQGCSRLKCIIFNNIQSRETIPTGYKSSKEKFGYSAAKGDVINDDEILVGHEMSDFLYGTAESGELDTATNEFAITYTSPVRVFCDSEYVNDLKKDMLIGKRVTAGNTSSGTKSYNSQVFVHSLNNLFEYKYTVDNTEYIVNVAVQEIYKASNGQPTTNILGYSLVYWSARSEIVQLPTQENLTLNRAIVEVAAYAIPTSVRKLIVPASYTRFEHDAFNSCSQLSEIEFEDINTLTYIGQYAFFGTAIESFTGGTGLRVIANYAFNRCESLRWVDLRNTPIVNSYNGRMIQYYQYKYEYELDDYESDFSNCLGNSAFEDCVSLVWVYLPAKIVQLRSSTFVNCHSLKRVVIPTERISSSTSSVDDECFYEYAQPRTVFDAAYLHQISFYVNSRATEIHNTILPSMYIAGGVYQLLESFSPIDR